MALKHINNRSDFGIVINFFNPDGSLRCVPSKPFRMIFSTSGGGVTYEVNSNDSKYCRLIDASTLSVFFDFSNHAYFRNGELTCTVLFSEPNEYFKDGRLDSQQPFRTGYIIWDGDSDFSDYLNVHFITNYESSVVQLDSILQFPNVGNEESLYVDRSANKTYRWDSGNRRYYCVGSDYNDIEIIDSGNAGGLGKETKE